MPGLMKGPHLKGFTCSERRWMEFVGVVVGTCGSREGARSNDLGPFVKQHRDA